MSFEFVTKLPTPTEIKEQYPVPEAIKELVEGIQGGKKEQVLLGATGTGKTFTIANVIAETASELLGKKPVEVVTNSELPRKPGLSLDNTKIKSLGWSLETSMKEGIKNTINQIINRL